MFISCFPLQSTPIQSQEASQPSPSAAKQAELEQTNAALRNTIAELETKSATDAQLARNFSDLVVSEDAAQKRAAEAERLHLAAEQRTAGLVVKVAQLESQLVTANAKSGIGIGIGIGIPPAAAEEMARLKQEMARMQGKVHQQAAQTEAAKDRVRKLEAKLQVCV